MKKTAKIAFIISGVMFSLFIIFTLLVKFVNVDSVGPNGTNIGFAVINKSIFNLLGENIICYYLSDICFYLSILIMVVFSCVGVFQLIRNKSVLKVDKALLGLAITYLITIIMFVLFKFIVVNFRPILIDGELVASYPSMHVMVVCVVMMTLIFACDYLIKNKKINLIIKTASVAISVATIIGRLFSGVHWFTDVIASVILSSAIVALYYALTECLSNNNESNEIDVQQLDNLEELKNKDDFEVDEEISQ